METIWDWTTVFCFAGLVTLMLQRSMMDEPPDSLWHYAPPAIGCAVVNYIGNEGYHAPAALGLALIGLYVHKVLKVSFKRSE